MNVDDWNVVEPNKHYDWLNQRSDVFDSFECLGSKKRSEKVIFNEYSSGVVTSRDAWAYNFGKNRLAKNMQKMINMYNQQRVSVRTLMEQEGQEKIIKSIRNHLSHDSTRISWARGLINAIKLNKVLKFETSKLRESLYRPFSKQWLYYDQQLNEVISRMPKIFPIGRPHTNNRVILTDSTFNGYGMVALMSDLVPDLNCNGVVVHCFPLKLFENSEYEDTYSAVSKYGVKALTEGFSSRSFTPSDVFYYIYGVFHSLEYLKQYKNNLSKQLPRIPKVKREEDFWAFSNAGRELGDLHCGYEDVEPYKVTFSRGDVALSAPEDPEAFYRVTKMKFAKKGEKSTVVYNANITMTDIPLEAYEYVINRKPALEWVMDRQCVKTEKRSGIVNDANHYAIETVGDPAYPLKLFQRVITVSLETMRIVKSLPKLDIDV